MKRFISLRNFLILATILAWVTFSIFYKQSTSSVVSSSIIFAIPLALAACVGVICERSGVINIGIEGTMLLAGFSGFFFDYFFKSAVMGILMAFATGLITGLLHALMTITWKMNQIIAGTIINILAAGITSFLYSENDSISGTLPEVHIPGIQHLPVIGSVLYRLGPISYFGLIFIPLLWVALYKTQWGLRTRAIGEHPGSADTAGVSVIKLRYLNVIFAGGIGGMAGAFTIFELTGSFERNFTAGSGFTALALMIFGRWNPMGAMAAAMFFGFMQAMTNQLQIVANITIPNEFVTALPYILVLVVLAFSAGKVRPPAAEGKAYEKESA
jgi:simple sugar transport system permease protein